MEAAGNRPPATSKDFTPPHHLSPEAEVIYWTARPEMVPGSTEKCSAILRQQEREFDWGRLIDLALRHRVLQLIAWNFDRYTLGPISQSHHFLMRAAYSGNSLRNLALSRELRQVLAKLNQRNIHVVLRKGAALAHLVYSDPGIRYMNDTDFFVPESSLGPFTEVMAELGYIQGTDSPDRRTISPLARDAEVQWKLQIGSLPPFLRTTSEPYLDIFYIDVRRKLMEPASGKSVPTEELIERSEQAVVASEPAWILSPEDFLIDLAVHIHRESDMLQAIAASKDLCIYRFVDVVEFCRHAGTRLDPKRLADRVRRYNIQKEVYYGLHFTNVYFGGVIAPQLLEATRPEDTGYLEEYGALDRQVSRWSMEFFDRLFDWRRSMVAGDSSRLVRPRQRRGSMPL